MARSFEKASWVYLALIIAMVIVELFGGSLSVSGNEVIGCGGFIKSNTEINYKIIKVKLLTKDGAVKYTTEASPVNGYYMIPIYNKGDYLLQVNPPLGWSFEPNQVSISIDGKNDPCSKNEDINFFFKGFGLSGKVVTDGDTNNEGPSGLKLTLIQNGKPIGTTQSGADGSYYFSNVMPGTYEVEAALDSDLKFSKSKVTVLLSKDNWHAKEKIIVSGYKIEGTVLSSDKTPIANAVVELHFFDQTYSSIPTANFECSKGSKSEGLKICDTKSDPNGKFSFSNVAFGKYKLKSSLNIDNTLLFTTKPESIDVDLTKHKNVLLNQFFQLNTVSINSVAVLSDKNKPLETGEVYLNNKKLSGVELKKDGKFSLEKLETGEYKIEIKAKNVHFEAKKIKIDLSNPTDSVSFKSLLTLSRFQAKSFDVCGKVKINNPSLAKDFAKSVKINVYKAGEPSSGVIKSASLTNEMDYCLELESNRNYVIRTELIDSLDQLLRLVPIERQISVVDSPLFEINFEQLEAKLDGQIRLIAGKQATPKDLIVYLNSIDSKQVLSKEIQVKCVQVKDGPIECSFSVSKLLFGKYQLSTNYDQFFCWKQQSQQEAKDYNKQIINIDSETQTIRMEQTGFKINVKLSHSNANIKVVGGGDVKSENILYSKNILTDSDLAVGSTICLNQIADYKILIDSCHKFTPNEPDMFEIESKLFTRDSNTVSLIALKHKLTVEISFKLYDDLNNDNLLDEADLQVEAARTDIATQNQNELIKFKLKSKSRDELVFVGHGWFEANKPIKLVARSDKVLFEVNNKVKKIDEFKCESNLVEFEAKLGIFIVGTIDPSNIDSIDLTVKSTLDNSTIEKLQINAAHGFRLGPFRAPFSLYSVELTKPGYLFTKVSNEAVSQKNIYAFKYQVEKLGHLKVNVVDTKMKTNLENVLMSLSSENRLFRQTIKTDINGMVLFDNLKPGLYYLIVMMQEYEFKPNSHPIQITDGFNMNLVVEADRIAYSCFGRVTSINGRAEGEGVLVEAVGLKSGLNVNLEHDLCKSSRENAELDVGLGTYRIRNLKPNCVYELNVKNFKKDASEQQQPTRNSLKIVPNNYIFKVNKSDILEQNFIVINQCETVDVSLSVTTSRKFDNLEDWSTNLKQSTNSFVRVKIFKTFQPDNVLSTQYSPANSIVYLTDSLDRDDSQQYAISVELLVSSTTISATSSGSISQQQIAQLQQLPVLEKTELSFYADSKHKHFQVKFDLDKKKSAGSYGADYKQQYQNFYFTLPLFIIAIGIFLNLKKAREVCTSFVQSIQRKDGLKKIVESFWGQNKNERETTGQQSSVTSSSTKVVGKSAMSRAQKPPKDLSDNEKIKQIRPIELRTSGLAEAEKNSEENSDSDYVDYTSEEGETLTIVKKRPRKI